MAFVLTVHTHTCLQMALNIEKYNFNFAELVNSYLIELGIFLFQHVNTPVSEVPKAKIDNCG